MSNLKGLVEQLKRERDVIQRRLSAMNAAIAAFAAVYTHGSTGKTRTMSTAARTKIAAAQRERWKKVRATKGSAVDSKPAAKRVMSASARARIAAAQRARWAKARAKQKTK